VARIEGLAAVINPTCAAKKMLSEMLMQAERFHRLSPVRLSACPPVRLHRAAPSAPS